MLPPAGGLQAAFVQSFFFQIWLRAAAWLTSIKPRQLMTSNRSATGLCCAYRRMDGSWAGACFSRVRVEDVRAASSVLQPDRSLSLSVSPRQSLSTPLKSDDAGACGGPLCDVFVDPDRRRETRAARRLLDEHCSARSHRAGRVRGSGKKANYQLS